MECTLCSKETVYPHATEWDGKLQELCDGCYAEVCDMAAENEQERRYEHKTSEVAQ